MTVRLKVINRKEFEDKIKKMSDKTLANLKKTVRVTANETRNTAVNSILQNARSGGEVTRYNPNRTIRISAEGSPPASDTGFLASNIHLIMDGDQLGASVESRADYSKFLEFGTLKMRARPFMQPALEQGKRKYKLMFEKAVKDGI